MNTSLISSNDGSLSFCAETVRSARRALLRWACIALMLATATGWLPLRAAQPTSFDVVTRQLDPGGTLYLYLSTAQCLTGLSSTVDHLRDEVLNIMGADADGEDRANVNRGFSMVSRLIRRSGLEALTGIGVSGVEISDGLYRTKVFVHRSPSAEKGYGATLFGRTPHPLECINLLPQDTVYAAFHDLDTAGLWSAIEREVADSGFRELQEGLDELREGIETGVEMPIGELLGSFKGEFGVVLTLNADHQVPIPLPSGNELQIDEPRLAIVLKVNNDALFNRLEELMSENPEMSKTDTPKLRARTVELPLPIPMPVRPTIARIQDYLVIATTDTLVQQMADVRNGDQAGLRSAPTFQRLAAGMEFQGNGFAFLDQRLTELVRQIQMAALETQLAVSSTQMGGPETSILNMLQRLMGAVTSVEEVSVSANTDEGWRVVSHGNREPAQTIITVAGVAPAAVLAGMMLPALSKAKTKAQSISCVNNLKQICLGARIYAVDHDDVFPPDFASMQNELATPRILYCPADPRCPNPLPTSWDDVDMDNISYEFLKPGVEEVDTNPSDVIFRCRHHGHTGHADGSVRQSR